MIDPAEGDLFADIISGELFVILAVTAKLASSHGLIYDVFLLLDGCYGSRCVMHLDTRVVRISRANRTRNMV